MSFDTIDYAHKRVRQQGTKELKLWFSEKAEGLQFRIVAKDRAEDCYEVLSGIALASTSDDAHIMDDDNDDAYFTDMYRYASVDGTVQIYLESNTRELVWLRATGEYAAQACPLGADFPLMPEIAG